MGREAKCQAEYRGEQAEGRAHLDTDALTFRGGFRLKIPYSVVESAEAVDGILRLGFRGDTAAFHLGADSTTWADRILNPPSLIKKLGVKAGMTAGIAGDFETGFYDDLAREGVQVVGDSEGADALFFRLDVPNELNRIPDLKQRIPPNGAIWVITPRGRKELQDVVIIAAGRAAGLVDNKVCRFSDTHTALRFVIPKADRSRKK